MRKLASSKLTLGRQTIRVLDELSGRQVIGGGSRWNDANTGSYSSASTVLGPEKDCKSFVPGCITFNCHTK